MVEELQESYIAAELEKCVVDFYSIIEFGRSQYALVLLLKMSFVQTSYQLTRDRWPNKSHSMEIKKVEIFRNEWQVDWVDLGFRILNWKKKHSNKFKGKIVSSRWPKYQSVGQTKVLSLVCIHSSVFFFCVSTILRPIAMKRRWMLWQFFWMFITDFACI